MTAVWAGFSARLAAALLAVGAALVLCPAAPAQLVEVAESRTDPLNAEAYIRIVNPLGGVRVEVWDRDEAKLEVMRRAEARELFPFLQVEVETGWNRFQVTVSALPVPGVPPGVDIGEVNLVLTVPRPVTIELLEARSGVVRVSGVRGAVTASTTSGNLQVQRLAGNVDLRTEIGALWAQFDLVRDEQRLRLASAAGSIRLGLPSDVAANLRVRCGGPLKCGFDVPIREEEGAVVISAELNTGGALVEVTNARGRTEILKR